MAIEAPIFIVGAARSGTTLLRNLLDRHPRIAICPETHFHHKVYMRRRAFGDLSDLKNRRRVVEECLAFRRLRFVTDRAALTEKLMREATSYQALFTCIAKNYAESQGKERWGEKTPLHSLFSETLCEWYPGATLIHMIRDPRDVVASMLHVPFAGRSVVLNTRRWLRFNLAAQRCSNRPQYLPVRYELLVTQPEQELARVCARLGEEYVPSMLDPRERAEFPPAVPWMRRAHQPITTKRIGKWREELTAQEVSQIEWTVGAHMETFGYERAMDPPSSLTIARGLGFAMFDKVHLRFRQFPDIWHSLVQPTKLTNEESWLSRRRAAKSGELPTNTR